MTEAGFTCSGEGAGSCRARNDAADILIVVDNSGSMLEEQQNLAANFFNLDPAECPIQDLTTIPSEFKRPIRSLYTGNGPLAQCGFIQLLAAFENEFRVGVITTDVGLCDNRLPASQGGAAWGFRPQRGCLQPDGPPGAPNKFIAAIDLTDADPSNDDLAQRFADTLTNIQTFGSPFERGLDAMAVFLDPSASRGPGCEGDLDAFRRNDAALVVIFFTDEDDCSHGLGASTFEDELEGEVCGAFDSIVTEHRPANCYAEEASLSPIGPYVDALLAADSNAKVAVIAGGLGLPGDVAAAGCRVGNNGAPVGGCFESGGLSNFTAPGQPCDPSVQTCCLADAGDRYYEFANEVGNKTTDSICNESFRSTMLGIAAFIAADGTAECNTDLDCQIARGGASCNQSSSCPDDEFCAVGYEGNGFCAIADSILQDGICESAGGQVVSVQEISGGARDACVEVAACVGGACEPR